MVVHRADGEDSRLDDVEDRRFSSVCFDALLNCFFRSHSKDPALVDRCVAKRFVW